MSTNNSSNQIFTNNADGFSIGGGVIPRTSTVLGGNLTQQVQAQLQGYAMPKETCTLGRRFLHGNNSRFENGWIWGKACMGTNNFTGTGSATTVVTNTGATFNGTNFFPHFAISKPATAVLGNLWTYWGMSKGSAVVNTTGNFLGANSAPNYGIKIGTGTAVNSVGVSYWQAVFGAHDGSLPGVKCAVGVYTGTGVQKGWTGLGFQPDLVIIKGTSTTSAVWKTQQASGTCSYFLIGTADITASAGIVSLDADGFTVGTGTTVNTASTVYQWMAFKSDSSGLSDICLTKYQGMVGDGLHVELPFQADIIFVIPAGAVGITFCTSAMTLPASAYVSSATANTATGIQQIDSFGFTAGSSVEVNTVNNAMDVIAFRADKGIVTLV